MFLKCYNFEAKRKKWRNNECGGTARTDLRLQMPGFGCYWHMSSIDHLNEVDGDLARRLRDILNTGYLWMGELAFGASEIMTLNQKNNGRKFQNS